jgi:hypothetical protein
LGSTAYDAIAANVPPLRRLVEERLQAISEVHRNSASLTLSRIRDLLRHLPDLERGLSRIHFGRATPSELYRVLEAFQRVGRVFEEVDSPDEDQQAELGAGSLRQSAGGSLHSSLLLGIVKQLPRVRPIAESLLAQIDVKRARDNNKEHLQTDVSKYPELEVRPAHSSQVLQTYELTKVRFSGSKRGAGESAGRYARRARSRAQSAPQTRPPVHKGRARGVPVRLGLQFDLQACSNARQTASRSRSPKRKTSCLPIGSRSTARSKRTGTDRLRFRSVSRSSSSGKNGFKLVSLTRVRCASHPFADHAVLSRSRRCRFPNLPPVSAVDVERVHSYAGADERGYPFREVSSHYEQFRTAISALATADCVFSLAQVALTNNWARPEIADTVGVVDIVDARHPIIEEISPQPFVPNTIRFGGEYRKQMVLTGLNMGGKLRRLLSLLPDSPLLTACALQANRACRGVSP